MRKIINGRTYNTETSKKIGEWWNGLATNDFSHCYEVLYKNTRGAYFIHGEGGAMSKYAISTGTNSWSGGEKITPLTSAEATEWAEKHLSAEEYEAEFGEVEEAESDLVNRERVNLTLDSGIMVNLRKLSKDTGVPMSQLVDKAILAMYEKDFKADIER